ncbi:MAG: carbohydate-binding domain-containing protein [Lewinellaceae bacterium]|nr:carbohydate-binding domain-containing protein [Lewinellaceae bacterium]
MYPRLGFRSTVFFYYLLLGLSLFSCQKKTQDIRMPAGSDITLVWEHVRNARNDSIPALVRFSLINQGDTPLPSQGWAIYFSYLIGPKPAADALPGLTFTRISGDFFSLSPTTEFAPLVPGEKRDYEFSGAGYSTKTTEGPTGAYIVFTTADGQESIPELIQIMVEPYTRAEQIRMGDADQKPLPTAENAFIQQAEVSLLPASSLTPVLPSPYQWKWGKDTFQLTRRVVIVAPDTLQQEARLLNEALRLALGNKLDIQTEKPANGKAIVLELRSGAFTAQEAYSLRITADQITIAGEDLAGVFYGIQSLRQLLPLEAYADDQSVCLLPAIQIDDQPRFGYRGFHLDVSRNFHSAASVRKLLDVLAFYKINTFHFHLTDDEGWRLEIPDLPELTQVGGYRGHTLDESNRLRPAYGSGPFADPARSPGSGFYTRAEFIDILRYARERHIKVIPEIDVPGHARAAIKAMEARYTRLVAENKTEAAERYRLLDPSDQSQYRSVQNYPDNVLNVCRESTYAFLTKVVDELQKMYADAGLTMQVLHVGGDEVPTGVWQQSPLCQELLAVDPTGQPKDILTKYFLRRLDAILEQRDIRLAGWEEIALQRVPRPEGGYRYDPNPTFLTDNFLPFVWNSQGEAVDLGYRLANAGYDVILSAATNLYFDLAYDNHPEEPGLYWSGYVDTKTAWRFSPMNMFAAVATDRMGRPLGSTAENRSSLNLDARDHILGIQGQLWSETIKNPGMLEYYLLPKLLGLAERAWAPQPSWETLPESTRRNVQFDRDWNAFANRVGQRELPRLDYLGGGYQYRLPPPGAQIVSDTLQVNVAFPGLAIRYTTDGNDPSPKSAVYEGPVAIPADATVKLKTFSRNGRGSRTVAVER